MPRVERRGLAELTAVPGDRRALRLAPTETGCRAADAFKADMGIELRKLVDELTPELGEHLRGALAQIVSARPGPRACRGGPL